MKSKLQCNCLNSSVLAVIKITAKFVLDVMPTSEHIYLSSRQRLFNAIETMPCIMKKAQWALNWINPERVSLLNYHAKLPYVFNVGLQVSKTIKNNNNKNKENLNYPKK